jgi:hypothetical protein
MNWIKRFLGSKEEGSDSDVDQLIGAYEQRERNIKQAGTINGKHYTQFVDRVKQLKTDRKHEEANILLLQLVSAVEKEAIAAEWGVAPWYYEQLAVIYRKEKRYDEEVAILERYQSKSKAPGAKPSKMAERLIKAKELRDRQKA